MEETRVAILAIVVESPEHIDQLNELADAKHLVKADRH